MYGGKYNDIKNKIKNCMDLMSVKLRMKYRLWHCYCNSEAICLSYMHLSLLIESCDNNVNIFMGNVGDNSFG